MIREFCNMLKDRIVFQSFPFVETVAGVVQAVSFNDISETGERIKTVIPVSADTNEAACYDQDSPQKDLVPNSTKRGVLYFEENGARVIDSNAYGAIWQANINLICWYNKALIVEQAYGHVQNVFIEQVINTLVTRNPFNQPPFTRVQVNVTNIAAQDNRSFKKYTYNETDRQYLMQPFEFFNLTLECRFNVITRCNASIITPVMSDCRNYIK